MKIRSDFVTNSSSSSYCVSFNVVMASKKIKLDYWPDGEDGSGDVYVVLRSKRNDVVDRIKAATSAEELKSIIVRELDFSSLYDDEIRVKDFTVDGLLNLLDQVSEIDDVFEKKAIDTKAKLENFSSQMDEIKDFSKIKKVVLHEYFTGWGEFARDAVDRFLDELAGRSVPCDDKESFTEALSGKLSSDLIDLIYENHCVEDCVCTFDASIYTTINLEDGSVVTECVDLDLD